MKSLMLSLAAFALLAVNVGFASPQAEEGQDVGTCEAAPVPTAEQNEEAFASYEGEEDAARAYGYWHCTAYAEGHGHNWGYSYYDVHYSHAYYGAMRRCEMATHHHCHDVHCHYDHH